MKLQDILTPSFRALSQELGHKPHRSMVEECRADDSDFCQEVVRRGWLTEEQMHHAAERYQLGKSRSGRCIFWMIDRQGRVRDGHVGDQWVTEMLKARAPELLGQWHAEHCLFGLETLPQPLPDMEGGSRFYNRNCCEQNYIRPSIQGGEGGGSPVCVVESERTAVVLSEIYPEQEWMASVYPANLSARLLEPLRGCQVTLFPNTDETGDTFLAWMDVAYEARNMFGLNVTVSSVLEEHASEEQTQRKIDLVDFLFEHG